LEVNPTALNYPIGFNQIVVVSEGAVFETVYGVVHVPSPRKKLTCLPAAGGGTKPAEPAAEEVAPVIFE
jgi:hypothetical protein